MSFNFNKPPFDSARWGVDDFTSNFEKALRESLASGADFDTGWYAVKKEIQTGRIRRVDRVFKLEVCVSDDFDNGATGSAEVAVPHSTDVDRMLVVIKEGLAVALNEAHEASSDSAVVALYCVGSTKGSWAWTYLQPVGDGHNYAGPPGDYYRRWGWQEVDIDAAEDARPHDLPVEVAKKIEALIEDDAVDENPIEVDGFFVFLG